MNRCCRLYADQWFFMFKLSQESRVEFKASRHYDNQKKFRVHVVNWINLLI